MQLRFTAQLLLMMGLICLPSGADAQQSGQFGFGDPNPAPKKNAPQGVIARTAAMVNDAQANFFAAKYGLDVLNVTWEDTARFKGSAVGPNISDVTIQVQRRRPKSDDFELTCMPVIRFPNFTDKTADISPQKFKLLVGNEKKGGKLKPISLYDYLKDFREYLVEPESWKGDKSSLLAERDSHVLVSAQACFLPIPAEGAGTVEFNPVIFNYQSHEKNPAVLVILATREGSSATVIDNKRDAFQSGFNWGQRLFFNKHGSRACLTGQRKSAFDREKKDSPSSSPVAAGEEGLNLVLMIQVPLKHKPLDFDGAAPGGFGGGLGGFGGGGFGGGGFGGAPARSNVESAVIGHGKVEGPFTEIDNLPIERDPKFPIRVTVQFYKATSNGVVSDNDMSQVANQIHRVYSQADYVGSLVVGGPSDRPTEYAGSKVKPLWWWNSFWRRHEANTGLNRVETMKQLYQQFGPSWRPKSRAEMIRAVKQIKDAPAAKPGGLF